MRRVLYVLLLLAYISAEAAEMTFGRFTNTVKAEWVRGPDGERRMRLLEDFGYVDPNGRKWIAPKGSETDGASIPRVFWTIIGAPFDGQYREAAVIHDVYCDTKTDPWQDVHRVFYYANRAAGVSEIKSKILYTAVRVAGPKWEGGKSRCYAMCHAPMPGMRTDGRGVVTVAPSITEAEAEALADWVATKNPSLEEIDGHILEQFPKSRFGH